MVLKNYDYCLIDKLKGFFRSKHLHALQHQVGNTIVSFRVLEVTLKNQERETNETLAMAPFYAYQHVCGGYMSILQVQTNKDQREDLQRNSRNGMKGLRGVQQGLWSSRFSCLQYLCCHGSVTDCFTVRQVHVMLCQSRSPALISMFKTTNRHSLSIFLKL